MRWGVNGVSKIQAKSRDYRHEMSATDPVTGETVHIFPATTRLKRQLLVVPFAIIASIILGSLIAIAFGIEIFISEVYDGPLKWILIYLPTGILSTGLPALTAVLTQVATRLTKYENYETQIGYQTALTQKLFVLNFVTSYLPIFLTAFVYVPFGNIIVPYLDVFSVTVQPFANHDNELKVPSTFRINPDRLRKQVIYFTVTAQLVGFAMEVVVPYLKRQGFIRYKAYQSDRAAKKGGVVSSASESDHPDEAEFLKNVRYQVELDVYDVQTDLREMVVQFGYLALFSVVWPLAGVSFLINNWIELRADAVKICIEMQRPTPSRRDTIGPWLESLGFLAWLGSLTGAALTYLFSNDGLGPDGTPYDIKGWGLLLSVMLSEHLYLGLRVMIRKAISKIDTPGRQKERRDRYLMRKTYFQESLDEIAKLPSTKTADVMLPETISRDSLEEEARQSTLGTRSTGEKFWARQRSWRETVSMGQRYIMAAAPAEGKKVQ